MLQLYISIVEIVQSINNKGMKGVESIYAFKNVILKIAILPKII